MAVMVTADIPGGTAEQDEATLKEMNVQNERPKGVLARAAHGIPGGWRIISIWESREAFERAYRDKIEPASRVTGQIPSRVEMVELHSMVVPGAPR